MYPQPSKSKTFSNILGAVLQIAGSILAAALFLGLALFRLVTVFTASGSLLAVLGSLLAGVCLSGILLYSAVRTFSLMSRCRVVTGEMEKRLGRLKLDDLARKTGRPPEKLSDEIQIMIRRGYFSIPVQYDLYRRELVPGVDTPIEPPEPDPSSDIMYKIVTRRSPTAFYAFFITWLLYAMLLPLGQIRDFAVAAALSVIVFLIARRMTPPIRRLVETKRPAPKKEPVRTGNKDVDETLKTAFGHLEELQRLDRAITDEKIDNSVKKLVIVAQDILTFLSEHPEKMRQTRQFLAYYLPTTVKLLNTYDEFARQQAKGDNIRQSMSKIEGMVQDIVVAFQKELDNLYFDKAIDVSTDIDVMQSMLQREGIGAMDLQH